MDNPNDVIQSILRMDDCIKRSIFEYRFFASNHQQQLHKPHQLDLNKYQHLQQHHQLHVDDMSSSGQAAPIGLRLLRPSTHAPSDWPMAYKDFDHDLQCLRQGEGQVFFWHMRKAGGTNIRDVLCQMHDALPKGSFRFAVVEGPTMNASCFDERSRVFVTSLRDPIDRIIR